MVDLSSHLPPACPDGVRTGRTSDDIYYLLAMLTLYGLGDFTSWTEMIVNRKGIGSCTRVRTSEVIVSPAEPLTPLSRAHLRVTRRSTIKPHHRTLHT